MYSGFCPRAETVPAFPNKSLIGCHDDYLKKPFSIVELQTKVEALFELSNSKVAQPKTVRNA